MRTFLIVAAAALIATTAQAQASVSDAQGQAFLKELDAVDAACPPIGFRTMLALITCQYQIQRPVWLHYAPEMVAAYDDSVLKRRIVAEAFDSRRITGDQTIERFQQIQLEFVAAGVAVREAQIAKVRQTLREEETREQGRRMVRGLADAVKTYNETRQQSGPAPRPPVITNCVTTGAFTNCASQ